MSSTVSWGSAGLDTRTRHSKCTSSGPPDIAWGSRGHFLEVLLQVECAGQRKAGKERHRTVCVKTQSHEEPPGRKP